MKAQKKQMTFDVDQMLEFATNVQVSDGFHPSKDLSGEIIFFCGGRTWKLVLDSSVYFFEQKTVWKLNVSMTGDGVLVWYETLYQFDVISQLRKLVEGLVDKANSRNASHRSQVQGEFSSLFVKETA